MPRLRVLAGPTPTTLTPISANCSTPHIISTPDFEGRVLVYIKGLNDSNSTVPENEYFGRDDRKGITWSIQVQGRFLQPRSADDVLFGNTFDRPLKLPWGSSVALKFMSIVDPTLEHDLASPTKPWALSPLIATMPHFAHARIEGDGEWPDLASASSLVDDTSQLYLAVNNRPALTTSSSSSSSSSSSLMSSSSLSPSSSPPNSVQLEAGKSSSSLSSHAHMQNDKNKNAEEYRKKRGKRNKSLERVLSALSTADKRRKHFMSSAHRQAIVFGPHDLLTTDFCYGFLEFSPTLALRLPGGVSFDLMHYWDGQPVRFVCCERARTQNGDSTEGEGDPWGKVFWCVTIELEEDSC